MHTFKSLQWNSICAVIFTITLQHMPIPLGLPTPRHWRLWLPPPILASHHFCQYPEDCLQRFPLLDHELATTYTPSCISSKLPHPEHVWSLLHHWSYGGLMLYSWSCVKQCDRDVSTPFCTWEWPFKLRRIRSSFSTSTSSSEHASNEQSYRQSCCDCSSDYR